MPGPLSHIRVLDLSRVVAGPWATQLLADLGADVVKVERPGTGDDTRTWGPPFLHGRDGRPTGESGYFLAVNRGKRSITVALDTPAGQGLIRKLAATADIVVENFKVGTLARFGLGYDDLRPLNPRLIYCSISGFGQDGPRAREVAYDFLIQAMGGLMSVTGEADARPGGGPQKVGVPIVDLATGLYATTAILAALAQRERSGAGEHIDLAMLDVQVALLANQAMNQLLTGVAPVRLGTSHPNIVPQGVLACRGGDVVLAVGNDGQFARLCAVLGRPEWAADPRFAENAARLAHRDTIESLLAAAFAARERGELVAALVAADVPCGPINSIAEVFDDPQVRHRGVRRTVEHPTAGPIPLVGLPPRFRNAALGPGRAPPQLGADTDAVLAELGLDAAAIAALRKEGAV